MHQLSGLDATFLYLETEQMPMHVGALHVFELPAGYRGRFLTALRTHIATRLPMAPVLRRRLWWMPLNMANPAWVDADPDLRQHIVSVPLAKGAGLGELETAVSRLHPRLLPRDRPLWKFHVFEGLAPSVDGTRRVALYTQLHHAAVDGQAAVALANAILDLTPKPRQATRRTAAAQPIYSLEMTEMLRGVLGSQAQKLAAIVRNLPPAVGTLKRVAAGVASRRALAAGDRAARATVANLSIAPRTAFSASVTEGRAFAVMTLPLAELKLVARAHGATLNDVVLMLCSSALRRYLSKRRALPRDKSLIAAVPITLRAAADVAGGGAAGNQASMSLVSLGTHIADAEQRLAHIRAATGSMKSTMGGLKGILPTDFPSLGMPWLIEAATALYGKARVADRLPQIANLVISNVPGPPVPLYLAGARMLTNYPASIVVHGLGLNITVQSYDGSMDFGLMADAQAMPDVQELAAAVAIAHDDLCALPLPGDADVAPGNLERVGRAARDFGVAMGSKARSAAGKAVDGAVQTAVQAALAQLGRSVPTAPRKGRQRAD